MESCHHIRSAEREEERQVRNVILSAFSLDADWNDMLVVVRQRLESALDKAFEAKEIHCLVLTHGTRIIGASLLDVNPQADNHLVSGPCVSSEYRNRGLGSALLFHSLKALREEGVSVARGVTKASALAAKFVYPKFNSTVAPCDPEPQAVGS